MRKLETASSISRVRQRRMTSRSEEGRAFKNCAEGWRPQVLRLSILPKAAYLEERCQRVVRLSILPKAAYLEGRCREVVLVCIP